jgi:predicted acetyltransferase
MTTQFDYTSIDRPDDDRQLAHILDRCFIGPPEQTTTEQDYLDWVGRENLRFIRQNGQILGGLVILKMGQWYGSNCVPMAGIASVGIAPQHRGSGAAVTLMQSVVKELYAQGTPISALYPAVQQLYRQAGYEQAGILCCWEAKTDSIRMHDRTLPLFEIDLSQADRLDSIYRQQAAANNGNLDRHSIIWEAIAHLPNPKKIDAFAIGSETQPQGYIIFSQNHEGIINIKDWVVLTPEAGRRFWTFLADHRSQMDKVHWNSAIVDPLSLLLPEQTTKLLREKRWMLRIIHVMTALAIRGYPTQLDVELHLDIYDDLILENNGKFILSVANGSGEVTRGGNGDLKIDIRSLAPLYTGLFTSHQLHAIGRIEGTEQAVSIAAQVFGGAVPWMPDFF